MMETEVMDDTDNKTTTRYLTSEGEMCIDINFDVDVNWFGMLWEVFGFNKDGLSENPGKSNQFLMTYLTSWDLVTPEASDKDWRYGFWRRPEDSSYHRFGIMDSASYDAHRSPWVFKVSVIPNVNFGKW